MCASCLRVTCINGAWIVVSAIDRMVDTLTILAKISGAGISVNTIDRIVDTLTALANINGAGISVNALTVGSTDGSATRSLLIDDMECNGERSSLASMSAIT